MPIGLLLVVWWSATFFVESDTPTRQQTTAVGINSNSIAGADFHVDYLLQGSTDAFLLVVSAINTAVMLCWRRSILSSIATFPLSWGCLAGAPCATHIFSRIFRDRSVLVELECNRYVLAVRALTTKSAHDKNGRGPRRRLQ